MDRRATSLGALVLRLMVGLALLGWPRVGSAQGTWSVISLQQPGDLVGTQAMAVDSAGNLYVSDSWGTGRIQKRDTQGNWSVIATQGTRTLAVDGGGNLYVVGGPNSNVIQKRDAQGNWSLIATFGTALGQVFSVIALAADTAGNLYVADYADGGNRIQKRDAQGRWSILAPLEAASLAVDAAGNLYVAENSAGRIQKRDARGNWSLIATGGGGLGQVNFANGFAALAVDTASNLYVEDYRENGWRIQKRDAQGNWSLIASGAAGPIINPTALAVDTAGNLYVTGGPIVGGAIQKRDTQGNWSVVATAYGNLAGQVINPEALAVDAAGNLYVTTYSDDDGHRIQKRDTQGNWSVIATEGDALDISPTALAADRVGNLYVAEFGWILRRDALGQWSVLVSIGSDASVSDASVQRTTALAVDTAGNLYVAERKYYDGEGDRRGVDRIQKRDGQGNWSVIAPTADSDLSAVEQPAALAVDDHASRGAPGNLYVADAGGIRRRDAQGTWSVIDGPYGHPTALAADAAGNLYVAEAGYLQKRNAQGNWSVIATGGSALGQVGFPGYGFAVGLAVDGAGNLYVADTGNNRVLKYAPAPPP